MLNPFKRHDRKEPLPPIEGEAALLENHPLAKRLPPAALLRYDELADEAGRLNIPLREIGHQIRALREDASRKECETDAWKYSAARVYSDEQLDAELEKRSKEVAALRAKAKRLDAQREAQSAIWGRLHGLVRSIERYAQQLATMPAVHGVSMTPAGDPIRAIEKAKAKIAALKAERGDIEAAPWPSSMVKAKAIVEIDKAAARGRPDVFGAIENNSPIVWPVTSSEHMAADTGFRSHGEAFDAFAFFAWLNRDQLVERTCAEIDERADDAAALTQSERDARQVDVAKRLLAAERDLEAAIRAAGISGTAYREIDQDPRAVLNLADTAPAFDPSR